MRFQSRLSSRNSGHNNRTMRWTGQAIDTYAKLALARFIHGRARSTALGLCWFCALMCLSLGGFDGPHRLVAVQLKVHLHLAVERTETCTENDEATCIFVSRLSIDSCMCSMLWAPMNAAASERRYAMRSLPISTCSHKRPNRTRGVRFERTVQSGFNEPQLKDKICGPVSERARRDHPPLLYG